MWFDNILHLRMFQIFFTFYLYKANATQNDGVQIRSLHLIEWKGSRSITALKQALRVLQNVACNIKKTGLLQLNVTGHFLTLGINIVCTNCALGTTACN